MPSKEIDRWLKAEIEKVPEKLVRFRDKKLESKMVYYTGNWHKDVIANLTQRQSEKLFAKMQKIQSDGGLLFFQKKNKNIEIGTWSEYGEKEPESISSYDYIIIKRA